MNSPRNPQTPSPSDALALYEKARFIHTNFKPLNESMAKMLIEMAGDAIREFGNTNQEKKVELRKMIEEAEDVLPPATIAELRKRTEGKAFKTFHPKGPRTRKVFYFILMLLLVGVPTAVFLRQFFKPGGESAQVPATPTPFRVETPQPPTNTPTPVQTPLDSVPGPTPGTGETLNTNTASPEAVPPSSAKQLVRNSAGQWVRLTYDMQWRVVAVQRLGNATRLFIEVKNTHAQEDQDFFSFAGFPLSLIDQNGVFHKMLRTDEAPEGVREVNKRWLLQPGRIIQLATDFAPLAPGITSGQVVYETDNRAEPAKFSVAQ